MWRRRETSRSPTSAGISPTIMGDKPSVNRLSVYLFLGLLVVLAAFGCLIAWEGSSAASVWDSPEDTARRSFECSPGEHGKNFQVSGAKSSPHGVIVLYHAECPPSQAVVFGQEVPIPERQVFGYSLAERRLVVWQQAKSHWTGRVEKPEPGQVIDFNIGADDEHAILYGRIFSQNVSTVEVILSDGRVLRDGTVDGMFALVGPVDGMCELRALDARGKVLQRVDRSHLAPDAPSSRCRPRPS